MAAKVFLVEDSVPVLEVCRIVLERRGFEIVVASSAAEFRSALEVLDRVDVLLTDCDLPGIHGTEVAAAVCDRWPETPVVYMTGGRVDAELRAPLATVLPKPFTPTELLACIGEALRP